MTEEIKEKRPRGNPNWVKKDKGEVEQAKFPEKSYSGIWTMLMQSTLQSWDAKSPADVAKAAALADAALEEFKKRFG